MNLEEIKQRESKATKGEWKAKGENNPYISEVEVENGGEKELIVGSQKHSDIEFIAHARQDIPDLIAEVERLREALAFYADKQNYDDSTKYRSDIAKDSGKKARQALGSDSNE